MPAMEPSELRRLSFVFCDELLAWLPVLVPDRSDTSDVSDFTSESDVSATLLFFFFIRFSKDKVRPFGGVFVSATPEADDDGALPLFDRSPALPLLLFVPSFPLATKPTGCLGDAFMTLFTPPLDPPNTRLRGFASVCGSGPSKLCIHVVIT
jgi:hypothetical protein